MAYIPEARQALNDALQSLKDAQDDPAALITDFLTDNDYGLSISVAGIDWKVCEGDRPLTVYVLDLVDDGPIEYRPILKFDLISDLISWSEGTPGQHAYDESSVENIRRGIASLQDGIDRLKAHEALLLSLQP